MGWIRQEDSSWITERNDVGLSCSCQHFIFIVFPLGLRKSRSETNAFLSPPQSFYARRLYICSWAAGRRPNLLPLPRKLWKWVMLCARGSLIHWCLEVFCLISLYKAGDCPSLTPGNPFYPSYPHCLRITSCYLELHNCPQFIHHNDFNDSSGNVYLSRGFAQN